MLLRFSVLDDAQIRYIEGLMVATSQNKPTLPAVKFIEGREFTRKRNNFLSGPELDGLRFALANKPGCGSPVVGYEGLFHLEFAGAVIYYSISVSFEIWLLDIESAKDDPPPPGASTTPQPPPSPEEGLLKKVLGGLVKGGAIAAGKKLFDFIVDHLHL